MKVDRESQTIVVRSSDGSESTFSVEEGCRVVLEDRPGEFTDLRKFDKVEVTFDEVAVEGDATPARTIDARHPRP